MSRSMESEPTSNQPVGRPRTRCRFARAILAVVAGCGWGCASIGAPGPVVADRPGFTDGPTALPAHALQLEAGVGDDRVAAAGAEPNSEYRSFGQTLLRAGVGGRTEARLFGNSYATRIKPGAPAVSGMEDAKIGAKVNLRSVPDSLHPILPATALLVATTLATGARGLTAGAAQPEAKVAMNWTTPTPLSVAANAGFAAVRTGSVRATHAWTSLAGWWAVNPHVSAFAEGLAFMPVVGNTTASREADTGLTYLVGDRLQFDLSVGHGVGSATSHERFVNAGLSRRW
jgi:hypothetical protein